VVSYHKRKKKNNIKDRLPEDIPVEVIDHSLSDEERTCPSCQQLMVDIGTKLREHLRLIPAQAVLERHVQHVYACKACEENADDVTVVTAKAPAPVFSGSLATAESIAHIAVQKFVMHAPLYRQEQDWALRDIHLSRQTMSNWLIRATKEYFLPIYRTLYKDLISRDVLHADETVLQVLKEPGKTPQSKSYMWLYRTSGDTDRPIVLYDYQADRRQERPQKFLEHFNGYLHTDGYTEYSEAS
jgi:transposase